MNSIQLIEDLREEIQKNAEILAQIFNERVIRYSDRDLSRLWRGNNYQYVHKVSDRITNPNSYAPNPDYIFPEKSLDLLETKLVERLGAKSMGCIKILSDYRDGSMNTLTFIEKIKTELGRVSGEVYLTNEELSIILGSDKDFIHRTLDTLSNPKSKRWYNPDYKFTLERLEIFINNFRALFYHRAGELISKINNFIELNPDVDYWHNKDYSIQNEHFFDAIDTVEKAYWFGFLLADGSMDKTRDRIKFELSTKDKDRITSFCNALGLNLERNSDYIKNWIYKGDLKFSPMSRIDFSSEIIAKNLKDYEFLEFKQSKIGMPSVIKTLIQRAQKEVVGTKDSWMSTCPGQIAYAWLLGFYDGDGTYIEGNQGRVYSSNILLLHNIKELFNIRNVITEGANNVYGLNLGPETFKAMISSWQHSMSRKRPSNDNSEPNLLDLL